MKKIRHVDTTGLPDKFDLADLVESGVTGEKLIEWYKERVKDGPPVVPRKKRKKATKKKPAAKKKTPPAAAASGGENVVPIPTATPEENADIPPEYSEDSLALRFTRKHAKSMAFCGPWETWLNWTGSKWEEDKTYLAVDLARKICRQAATEVMENHEIGRKRKQIANSIASRRAFSNVEKIARTDRQHVVLPSYFDADPWTLNTPDGVVDLKTGELRAAKRSDWCLKTTAVGPGGDCPTWLSFLRDCTHDDDELTAYLQRVAGYCLTGSVAEHVFFFCYGGGGNGKGTFMNTLLWLLDAYSKVSNMDTFTEQRFSKHSAEIAYFQGARIVTASETGAGQRWNEARIKSMTGGDPITAEFKHKNPFTFLPQFKLLFAGNHKPHLRNVDAAIKRRLYLIPFDFDVPKEKQDEQLPYKLQAEGPGILQWCIDGCLDWQKNSLNPPERVIATTSEYFETEDKIGTFIEECCIEGARFSARTTYLFERYIRWADEAGEYGGSRKNFLDMLATKGLRSVKRGGQQLVEGIGIAENEPPQGGTWDGYN